MNDGSVAVFTILKTRIFILLIPLTRSCLQNEYIALFRGFLLHLKIKIKRINSSSIQFI